MINVFVAMNIEGDNYTETYTVPDRNSIYKWVLKNSLSEMVIDYLEEQDIDESVEEYLDSLTNSEIEELYNQLVKELQDQDADILVLFSSSKIDTI